MHKVSVTIITLNEAAHIADAINSASWADEVIVVDSGSTDKTVEISQDLGATVSHRSWTGYVDQKNYATRLASYDWIFSLDADERIPEALATEAREILENSPMRHGYRMPRVTFHLGKWIRTTDFYPDYQLRLYDRRSGRWEGRYVHESVKIDGPIGYLKNELQHYSFRDLQDQINRINHYTTLAAKQMYESGKRARFIDLFQPDAAFIRNYLLRRGFLDGKVGFYISAIQAYSVGLKFLKLWELQNQRSSNLPTQPPPGTHA